MVQFYKNNSISISKKISIFDCIKPSNIENNQKFQCISIGTSLVTGSFFPTNM